MAEKVKSAWLAAIRTVFVPGPGQAYAGRCQRGYRLCREFSWCTALQGNGSML